MRRCVILPGLLAALGVLPGCLWLSGAITAVVISLDDGGSSGDHAPQDPEPPGTMERPSAASILLDRDPLAVAIGDFVPDDAEPRARDVAVIYALGQQVTLYRGDGEGRLSLEAHLQLRKRNTVAIAAVPALSGQTQGLLVATSSELQLVVWNGRQRRYVTSFLPLAGKPDDRRDLITLDHDGDQILDVAVSSYENNWVEFFKLSGDPLRLETSSTGTLHLLTPPLSLVAADFFPDLPGQRGKSDLAILAEEGAQTNLLLHLSRTSGFCPWPDDKILFTEPGLALARGDDYDLNGDGTPDIVASRSDGVLAVHVDMTRPPEIADCPSQEQSHAGLLKEHAGARHFSPSPAGVVALHLPGGLLKAWDRVTVDEDLNAVVCSYFDEKGDQAQATVTFPLPGKGRALAAGDLNGDCHDDLVAASTDPATPALTVLLARDQGSVPKWENKDPPTEDPFYYPFGRAAGEPTAPRQPPRLARLAHGWADADKKVPFLAQVDRDNDEIVVFYLEPDAAEPFPEEQVERYGGLYQGPIGVTVGNFDARPGDEILVGAQKSLYYFTKTKQGSGSQRRFGFVEIPFRELVDAHHAAGGPALPEFFPEAGAVDFELQQAAMAFLDDNDFLDVAIAFTYTSAEEREVPIPDECTPETCLKTPCGFERDAESQDLVNRADGSFERVDSLVPIDFVIVILNLGAPSYDLAYRKVRFYRVPHSPRDLEFANINEDDALDLMVACGGPDWEGSSLAYLLFGDPDPGSRGEFFDDLADPAQAIPPIAVCGPDPEPSEITPIKDENTGEVVGQLVEQAGLVKVVSNNSPLRGIPHRTPTKWPPLAWIVASIPDSIQYYERVPEQLQFKKPVAISRGTDPEGILVHDLFPEEAGRLDLAVIFEAEDAGVLLLENVGVPSGENLWKPAGEILPIGAPQHVAVLESFTPLTLAVAGRTRQAIEIYQQIGCPTACGFTKLTSLPLARPNQPGHFTGTAASSLPDGGLSLGLIVEDGELSEDGTFPIDLGRFPGKGVVTRERILKLGEPMGEPDQAPLFKRLCLHTPSVPVAICQGYFSGSDKKVPDLLVAVDAGRTIRCYRGQENQEGKVATVGTDLFKLEEPLLDWCAVEAGALLVATQSGIAIHQIDASTRMNEVRRWGGAASQTDPILRIAKGWISPRRDLSQDLFVAVLSSTSVHVLTESGVPVEVFAGPEGLSALGVFDVNGDGRDDIALGVFEEGESRLRIFLQSGPEGALEFTSKTAVAYPGFPDLVEIISLEANGDRLRDIAFGARTGQVFVFYGNGMGSFALRNTLFAGPELESLRAHDLDGDGLDEILAPVAHPGVVILPGQ